jgi:8-oxo-dGTP pyrophosphatase MutT (NUDIX family)
MMWGSYVRDSQDSNPAFVSSRAQLLVGDAVAAIVLLEDGRYLLQHRDNLPHIWYPNHWGCFGGTVEPGEDPGEALRRELREELSIEIQGGRYFTKFDFDLGELGLGRYYRTYYEIRISAADLERASLGEGKAVEAFTSDTLLGALTLTPYDAFALFLHARSSRLRPVEGQVGGRAPAC